MAIFYTDSGSFFDVNVASNLFVSGAVTISGSETTPATPSIKVYGDMETNGVVKFTPVAKNIDTSISGSYIFVSGSTNDLYFSQNGAGYVNTTRLRWLEGNLYTGLLNGGLITATTGSTTFNLSSGSGIIVNLNATLGTNPYPTITYVNWGTFTNQPITYLTSSIQTFVGISSSGSIIQQTTPWNDGEYNTSISIGTVLHQNQTTVNATITYPNVAYGYKQRTYDFIKAFGPLKISGYTLRTSGSLGLTVGSGNAFADGRNYQNDPNNPSYITDAGTTVSKIFRYYQSGSAFVQDTNAAAGYTGIDTTQYNPGGTGSLASVSPSKFYAHRIFWYPNSATKGIVDYYGLAEYGTLDEAQAGYLNEPFLETPNTQQNAIFLGTILIKGNSDFGSANDYRIIQGGLFRSSGGGGGSSGGGGATTPGGSTTQIQYNNAGAFGGVPTLTYDGTILKVTGSFSGSLTGSLSGTASWAANTLTASYVNPLVQNVVITGSTQLSSNLTIGGDVYKKVDNSPLALYGGSDGVQDGFIKISGNAYYWGMLQFNMGYDANNSKMTWTLGDTSELMRLTGGGSLLLGTTSSLARLQVKGTGATSATTALRVENTNASASLVVLDDGSVGVGTSTTTAKLDVRINQANTSTVPYLNLLNDAAGYVGYTFKKVGSNDLGLYGNYTAPPPMLWKYVDGTNSYVGVNTASPTYHLDVSGSARITNGLIVTGSVQFQSASLTVTGTTGSDSAVYGSELITGATATGTNWTGTALSTGYTHTPGSTVALTSSLAATTNTSYIITYTVSSNTAGRYESITYGGTTYMIYANNGTNTITLRTTTTGVLYIVAQSATDGQIAITSVKAINDSSALVTHRDSANNTIVQQRANSNQLYYGNNAGTKFNSLTIHNTAFGQSILNLNSSGNYNTAIGSLILPSSVNTSYIAAVGHNVFQNLNTAGNIYNVGIGGNIGQGITTSAGYGNMLIGWNIGNALTNASHNIAMGYLTLNNTTTGGANIALGTTALNNNTVGSYNIALGPAAGNLASTGVAVSSSTNSIFVGSDSRPLGEAQSNQIVIGYQALGLGSNSVTLGNDSITKTALKGTVLVGTTTSSIYNLDVSGSGRFTNGLTVTGSVNVSGSIYLRNNQYLKSDFSGGVFNVGVFGVDTNDSVVIGSTYAAGGIVSLTSGVRYDMKATGMGINTASPSAMLHVKGSGATSATTALRVTNTNSSASLVVLDNSNIGFGTTTPSELLQINVSGSDIKRVFFSEDASTSYGGGVSYDAGGDALKIFTRNGSTDINAFSISRAGYPTATNGLDVNSNPLYFSGVQSFHQIKYTSGTGLVFTDNEGMLFNLGNPSTASVKFTSTGNVLIGTTTDPGFRLNVSGSGRFTNNLSITGSLIASGTYGGIDTTFNKPNLFDANGIAKVSWAAGTLNSIANDVTLDWENKILYDAAANASINWENRTLLEGSGTYTALDYSTTEVISSELYLQQTIPSTVQRNVLDGLTPAGQIIEATVDAGVVDYNLVYLDTDGTWKGVKAAAGYGADKMLGICISQASGYVLIEGDIGISDDNSQGAYVIGANYGLPVYASATTGVMTTSKPTGTGAIVRVLGHIYLQSGTDVNWWLMKFRPSNDWYEI